jgi:urea transport system substrate-binding protein
MAPQPFRPAGPSVPAVVDQYRLLRLLGRGSIGMVFEAEDTWQRRHVAVKLLPDVPAADGGLPPLLREVQLAGQVRHPHVVTLYDAGSYPGGVYLVLELAAGGPVAPRQGNGPWPWRDATALLAAACEGAAALHRRGIIHCDIKPSNLLRGADGAVKLADFGLARWVGPLQRAAGWRRLAGTPHFMSPEQCREEDVDERTDVYALGATYYTLLTARPPFATGDPLRIMFEHCSAPAPDPRRAHPGVPRACAEVVVRAMAKRRADRHDGARALRDALHALLGGD